MRKLYDYEPAMTFAEIGKAIGCSEDAAKRTFHRAIDKLRDHPQRFKEYVGLIRWRTEIRREAQ